MGIFGGGSQSASAPPPPPIPPAANPPTYANASVQATGAAARARAAAANGQGFAGTDMSGGNTNMPTIAPVANKTLLGQ